jgi:PAS domain-containing protein
MNILGLTPEKNGYPPDNNLFNYVHPDDLKVVKTNLKDLYSKGKTFDRIFKILDLNHVEKTIRCIGELREDPIMDYNKYFFVIQDITRITNLESQVFNEREKYKMLAENSPYGIMLMKDSVPVYLNNKIIDWFGVEFVEG